MYGILLLASILLYRNYFYPAKAANDSLAHFTLVVIAAAIGFGAAAVITPVATRRLSKAAWIAMLLAAGAVVTGGLGPTFRQPAFLVIALALGVVAQGVAICATTILQQEIDDSYRGRVFALYDMLFNVPFVIGAVVTAQFIPDSGKSFVMITVAAAGYLLAAGCYALASRGRPVAAEDAGQSAAAAGTVGHKPGGSWPDTSPSASAQRRNS
jgi:MFS family permease